MTISYNTFPIYLTGTTPLIGPSYPVDVKYQPRLLTVQFGDGYTQQTPDGINYMLRTFTVTWEILTNAERTLINNFLIGQGGYQSFNWITPDGDTALVKCAQWTSSANNPGTWALTATFQEVPI
jgi:phage-related protein